MDQSAEKSELRERIRASRRARTVADRAAVADAIAARVDEVPGYDRATTVTAYAAFGTEPGTARLLDRLLADAKIVLLPIVHDDGTLGWVRYVGPESLRTTDLGIPEPTGPEIGQGAAALTTVDLMLIPALAVDRSGNRIGKGGGFYDRVLAAVGPDRPLRVAIVHDEDVLPADSVPVGPDDQRVHAILTPGGYHPIDQAGVRTR